MPAERNVSFCWHFSFVLDTVDLIRSRFWKPAGRQVLILSLPSHLWALPDCRPKRESILTKTSSFGPRIFREEIKDNPPPSKILIRCTKDLHTRLVQEASRRTLANGSRCSMNKLCVLLLEQGLKQSK